MKKGVIVGVLSSLILIISMWMPAMDVNGVTGSFMQAIEVNPDISMFIWGTVVLGALMALFAFMNKKATDIVGIIFAVITLLFGLLLMAAAQSVASGANDVADAASADVKTGVGMGIYMMIIGSIGAVVGFIMNLTGRKKG